MVTNQDQAQSVLYGPNGAVSALANGAVVVLCSTVSPDYVRQLDAQLNGEGRDLVLVDAPVSGGVARAADGTLTIMAAGSDGALQKAGSVLKAQ
jgi:3-hydroxyisobutyrate dehydrogenase-like beta-hydroxyacid dehydrogenase